MSKYKRGDHVTYAGHLAKYKMPYPDGTGGCIISLIDGGQAIVNEADLTPGWPAMEADNEQVSSG